MLRFSRYLVVSILLILATFMAAPLASASLTSVVTDEVGDAMLAPGIEAPLYQEIVMASITSSHGGFVFVMDLAAPIPNSPPLLPPGTTLIDWVWQLNTDTTKAPCGFPGAPGQSAFCQPFEFVIGVVWNGASFTGILIDRRPLLTGGNATIVSLPFTIQGSEVKVSLTGAIIDNPSSFGWRALTTAWSGGFGTDSFHPVDLALDSFGFASFPS